MGTVYVLHFDRPISPDHTCQHYVGYTSRSLAARLADHAAGRGARLTQVARERGISWQCVQAREGTRRDERRMKNRHETPRLCPICNGTAAHQWKERGVLISHKGRQHSIETLPKWAQETIKSLMEQRHEQRLQRQMDAVERHEDHRQPRHEDLIAADDLPF